MIGKRGWVLGKRLIRDLGTRVAGLRLGRHTTEIEEHHRPHSASRFPDVEISYCVSEGELVGGSAFAKSNPPGEILKLEKRDRN